MSLALITISILLRMSMLRYWVGSSCLKPAASMATSSWRGSTMCFLGIAVPILLRIMSMRLIAQSVIRSFWISESPFLFVYASSSVKRM